jgi:4-amino-4-deoxychorismate lyase
LNNIFLETIKALDAEVYHLSYHQARYESVLKYFGIRNIYNLREYINPPKNGLYRCRLTYDISKTPHQIEVSYHPYKKREIGSLKLIYDDTIEYSMKYANREELDALFNKRGLCDDVLIVKNSLLCDTSIANIAFFDGVRWVTPKKPLLNGTTRQRLLGEGRVFEEDIAVDDLKKYSKAALMNAMIDFDIISKKVEEIFC